MTEAIEDDRLMSLVDHLDELRTRILRCLAYLVVTFLGGLCIAKQAIIILEKPAQGITFQALSMEEPLLVYLKVSAYIAVVLALPLVLFEICRFVGPGLKPKERRVLSPIIFGSPLLFILGMSFAYFLVLPPMLHFFNSFGQGMSPINQRLDFYISLVTTIMLYMGLCFQLPIIIFMLALADLVNSSQLLSFWRYAIFGAAFTAAVITPDPTAFSMLIVMAALISLYFISVCLLKIFGR